MHRKQNVQQIAWFWDLQVRGFLDLEPPYQRRSVWNQHYRDFFIDTLLLGYPAPALFLFEQISPNGQLKYSVVDGKQRLTTIFSFIRDEFPVCEDATISALRGRYWSDLSDAEKREFWGYQFTVEYLPSNEEAVIKDIFDRINRNTSRLTAQELRHAKYGGLFINAAESASERIAEKLGDKFPYIAQQQRRQMRDVEVAASLLLLLERGPQGYSTAQMDEEFNSRDEEWDASAQVTSAFDETVENIRLLLDSPSGSLLRNSRLRNQADFYSLFGAVAGMPSNSDWPSIAQRLKAFADKVADEGAQSEDPDVRKYYEAARSASNDTAPRRLRIEVLKSLIAGSPDDHP